eukprot:CAMPEP_0119526814 /NCGR_PEP_ID=MMETSP1344-20130328/41357_1 /TAXON_ID=236787 /ORGANISM="Florenciella parvula, Strain CCMP2471" /LENGTH=101 /DNA_ID=CAMNT_0007565893 /DNA_START=83 /DNA_END=384 /DNA_ORIENTATION=+
MGSAQPLADLVLAAGQSITLVTDATSWYQKEGTYSHTYQAVGSITASAGVLTVAGISNSAATTTATFYASGAATGTTLKLTGALTPAGVVDVTGATTLAST